MNCKLPHGMMLKRAWASALIGLCSLTAAGADGYKVFVLAGQSNMEGKVQNKLLEHQARDEKTANIFAHLRDGDDWVVRDDVWIKFLDLTGGLSIGYGSRDRTGVELEFGTVMGDHFDEPVLLIKTAWGGHSLFRNFRPPSAGMPSEEKLAEELAKAQKRVTDRNEKNNKSDPLPTMDEIKDVYGSSYRNMISEVTETLANAGRLFPKLKGKSPEMAGFVWFQGWNDQYDGVEAEYESNLRHLIADVRNDLDAPELPVVVGLMGQNGSEPAKGAMLTIQEAQLAVADMPKVQSVRTDELVDKAAEALYPTWKDNFEEWEKTGSDRAYHYLGSAIWHVRMGHAFADAMLELAD